MAYYAKKMTSSTEPELHSLSRRRRGRADRPTHDHKNIHKNLKFGYMVPGISTRRDRLTDMLIAIQLTPPMGEVTKKKNLAGLRDAADEKVEIRDFCESQSTS